MYKTQKEQQIHKNTDLKEYEQIQSAIITYLN